MDDEEVLEGFSVPFTAPRTPDRRRFLDFLRYAEIPKFWSMNESFEDGTFEEPTYLTFKLEFGGWGRTVSDGAMSIGNGGTATTMDDTYNAIKRSDYDDYPTGLLDMHWNYMPGQQTMGGGWSTNNQYYNAVNWLWARNEDTRAKYLQAFVRGLMHVQSHTPWVFKAVSGIDQLLEFNAKRGSRLPSEGVKIQVTCQEDLQMTMKTLLTLYRKAAWDDLWQRWILPDIMRQFKLIIYVSECRRFHYTDAQFKDNGTLVDWVSSVYLGSSPLSDNSLRAFEGFYEDDSTESTWGTSVLPVFAFECSPCEIEIGTLFGNSLDTNPQNPEDTTFTVIVKNVKVYERNDILDNLGVTFIDELDSRFKRIKSFNAVGDALNQNNMSAFTAQWMNRGYFTGEGLIANQGYMVHNYLADRTRMKNSLNAAYVTEWSSDDPIGGVINFWKNVYDRIKNKVKGGNTDAPMVSLNFEQSVLDMVRRREQMKNNMGLSGLNVTEREQELRDQFRSDMEKNARDISENYEESKKAMAEYVKFLQNNLKNNTELYDRILEFLKAWEEQQESQRENMTPLDTKPKFVLKRKMTGLKDSVDIPEQELTPLDTSVILPEMNLTPLNTSSNVPDMYMYVIEPGPELPEQDMTELDTSVILPKQKLVELNKAPKLPEQDMTELDPEAELPEQELVELDPAAKLPEQTLVSLDPPADIPEMDMAELDPEMDIPEMELTELDPAAELPEQKLVELNNPGVVPQMELTELDPAAELPEQTLTTLDPEAELPEQELTELDPAAELPEQTLVSLDPEAKLPEQEMVELNNPEDIPEMNMTELDPAAELPEQELVELDPEAKLPEQTLVSLDPSPEIPEMEMTELDPEAKLPEQTLVSLDPVSTLPEQTLVSLDPSPEIPEMNMTEVSQDTTIPKMEMTEVHQTADTPGQKMVGLETETTIPEMDMVEVRDEYETPVMEMTRVEQTSGPSDKQAMVEVKGEVILPGMEMVSVDTTPSPKDIMDMTGVDDKGYEMPEMKMVSVDDKGYEPQKAPMIQVNDTGYKKPDNIEMVGVSDKGYEMPEMKMVSVDDKGYEPQKTSMVEITDRGYRAKDGNMVGVSDKGYEMPEMKMVSVDNEGHKSPEMNMTGVDGREYVTPPMEMVGTENNKEHTSVLKPVEITETEYKPVRDMVSVSQKGLNPGEMNMTAVADNGYVMERSDMVAMDGKPYVAPPMDMVSVDAKGNKDTSVNPVGPITGTEPNRNIRGGDMTPPDPHKPKMDMQVAELSDRYMVKQEMVSGYDERYHTPSMSMVGQDTSVHKVSQLMPVGNVVPDDKPKSVMVSADLTPPERNPMDMVNTETASTLQDNMDMVHIDGTTYRGDEMKMTNVDLTPPERNPMDYISVKQDVEQKRAEIKKVPLIEPEKPDAGDMAYVKDTNGFVKPEIKNPGDLFEPKKAEGIVDVVMDGTTYIPDTTGMARIEEPEYEERTIRDVVIDDVAKNRVKEIINTPMVDTSYIQTLVKTDLIETDPTKMTFQKLIDVVDTYENANVEMAHIIDNVRASVPPEMTRIIDNTIINRNVSSGAIDVSQNDSHKGLKPKDNGIPIPGNKGKALDKLTAKGKNKQKGRTIL